MKKYLPTILYFALSLYAIMNCEFLATLKTTEFLGAESSHLVYAAYSLMVASGVVVFYFYAKLKQSETRKIATLVIIFCVAAVFSALLAFSKAAPVFWVSLVGLFLLAGFNTGIVSYALYRTYQEQRPVGRILALSSLIGLGLHYVASLMFSGIVSPAPVCFAVTAPALGLMLWLLMRRLRLKETDCTLKQQANGNKKYVPVFVMTGLVIAVLSFLIGINDSLVAQRLVFHVSANDFFYPVLFYIPGQVLSCLVVDIQKGRFLHIATLACVILLIPTLLFLESPEEFYMNSGINYFVGGFFLVYIMTGFVSIANKAHNKLLAICMSGILYPAFCGIGGLLSPHIAFSMDTYMVLTGFALLIVLLVITAWLSQSLSSPASVAAALAESIASSSPEFDVEEIAHRYGLTARECEVLPYLLGSMTTEEIAGKLYISASTVKTHTRNILGKINVSSRRELRQLLL